MYDVTGVCSGENRGQRPECESDDRGTPVAKPGGSPLETEPLQKKRFYLTVNTIGQEEEDT